jgi:hypothetical protein
MRPYQGDLNSVRNVKMLQGVKSGEYNESYSLFEGNILLKELHGKAHCYDGKSICLAKDTVFFDSDSCTL